MNNTALYIMNIMKQENVSNQELADITNKSINTVLKWLNTNNPILPRYEELVIIGQRLGFTIDDILYNRYPTHYSIDKNVPYKAYIIEDEQNFYNYLSLDLLDDDDYLSILEAFCNDRIIFKTMANNFLSGKVGSEKDFNFICQKLRINYYRQGGQEGIGPMSYYDLDLYRDYINEVKAGHEFDDFDKDYITITECHHLIIKLSNKHPELVRKYIESLFDTEWNTFTSIYFKMKDTDKSLDKKHIILKSILKNRVDILNSKKEKDYEKLYDLLLEII